MLSTDQVKYKDRFKNLKNLLKNPLSMLLGEIDLNDADQYLNNLVNNRFGIRTLNLVLEQQDFEHEIRDHLFEQFFSQVQNASDHSTPIDLDYKREFAINHVKFHSDREPDDSHLSFALIFMKKRILATNDSNYALLTISLLNVLYLWFELAVLDLPILFTKVRPLFSFIHRSLSNRASLLARSIRRSASRIH